MRQDGLINANENFGEGSINQISMPRLNALKQT